MKKKEDQEKKFQQTQADWKKQREAKKQEAERIRLKVES